jgi:hypothetical protein
MSKTATADNRSASLLGTVFYRICEYLSITLLYIKLVQNLDKINQTISDAKGKHDLYYVHIDNGQLTPRF